MQAIKVDARRGNQSVMGAQAEGAARLPARRVLAAEPVLLIPRRLIDIAVANAKKTRYGLPTDAAILERWWINDSRPSRADRSRLGAALYAFSFQSCCELLGLDADEERKRVIAEIDDAAVKAMVRYFGNEMYERRAKVLACSGVPTAVGRQFMLGLVATGDYEEVADPRDSKALFRAMKRETGERARAASKRAKRLKRKKTLEPS